MAYAFSPDINKIWKYKPTNFDKVLFLLEFNIRISGESKSDLLQVIVGTPLGFLVSDKVVISTRVTLILKKYLENKTDKHCDI